jgi:oligoendopeptidase F
MSTNLTLAEAVSSSVEFTEMMHIYNHSCDLVEEIVLNEIQGSMLVKVTVPQMVLLLYWYNE